MTLRRRLIVLAAAAVAVAIAVAAVAVYVTVRGNLRGQVDTALRADQPKAFFVRAGRVDGAAGARPALPALALGIEARDAVRVALPPEEFGGTTGVAQVLTRRGDVLTSAAGGASRIPITATTTAVVSGRKTAALSDQHADGVHLRVLTARLPGGEVLQLARPLTDVDRTLRSLVWILLAVTAGGALVAAGLGVFVARGTLRPVQALTGAAEHVAATQDLSRRLPDGGDDELGRLGASFNTMLAALESSREAQRQLVADASHELRTPLTSVRTNVELLARAPDLPESEREAIVRSVGAQVEELSVLVGDLVDLARPAGQGGLDAGEVFEDVRLDLLVGEAVAAARVQAAGVLFSVDAEPCLVRGCPARLHRAVRNLLDNAVKWSPPGAAIEIAVRGGEVAVRDHGPGIAPEDLPHVFDRFYRAPAARGLPGSGLGLAIVRQVAEAHAGVATAEAAGGGGALLRLRLAPVA